MRPRMLHTWDCESMVLKVKVDEWEFAFLSKWERLGARCGLSLCDAHELLLQVLDGYCDTITFAQ